MKKFLKFILWSLPVLLLLIVGAVFVFIKTFDLNKYKTQISDIVYAQTGRKLALNGHAGLKISLVPTIELNDVTFSNASWAKEPNMIEAKTIDVTFSLMPLLKKELVVNKIYLNEPRIYLSVNEKGSANWDFSIDENVKKQTTNNDMQVGAVEVAQGAMLASIIAKKFDIENGMVLYQYLKSKVNHEIQIKSLKLVSSDADMQINADMLYNGQEIITSLAAGSINSLLQNVSKYPVKGKVNVYGATLIFDGYVSDVLKLPKYDFNINAKNPDGNFGAPAVTLVSKITGDTKNIALDINSLNVAENEIKGAVNVNIAGKKPDIKGSLSSQLIDINKFNKTKTVHNYFGFISSAHAANFVPPTPIDLSILNLLNANIGLDIKKIILNQDISFNDVKTDVVVSNGNANIDIKQIMLGNGNVNGIIGANVNNDFKVKLVGKDIILQKVIKDLDSGSDNTFGIINGGKTDFMLNLKGRGNNLRSIVENLDGQFITIVGESKIKTGTLKYLNGNVISQILSGLKLKINDKSLELNCAVVRSDIVNGKADFPKGIAFKSNRITIVSDGYVNLKNDNINLSIKPFNGKLSDTNIAQAISSMLKVSGTIEKPRLTIDNSSFIKNVVGVAAAGPAFLGSQFMLDVDDYPCYTALKGTEYEKVFPAPSGIKAAGKSVYQGANDVVSGGVNMVNDAAKGVINLLRGKK